jgi:hypothetical protein
LPAGHFTSTVPSGLASAVTLAGGSGTSEVGTTGLLCLAGPSPLALTACTENRYSCPLTRPVIFTERWLAPTSMVLPSPSTTYLVMSAPLGLAARQPTVTSALPPVAMTWRGAPGLPTGGSFFTGGGGGGGGSPPSTSSAYLSTVRTWCLSSTTVAVCELGALMNR